ncbi:hypothetical protein IID10_21180 [candidate division KSB1 bacterium]|nr:hypothetical protein [candidate division KSB1 bacterium]
MEFRSALQEIDKAAKKAREEAAAFGAVDIKLINSDKVEEWTLEVDGREEGKYKSRRASVIQLNPGLHKIRVNGVAKDGANKLSDEVTIRVSADNIAPAELSLS